MSDDKYTLPFSVKRNDRQSLTDQVFEGFRKSILSGAFKAGDVLSSRTALAAALNVSEIMTRKACVRLAKAGLVNPRPGVGSVVLARNEKLWRGRVLYVATAGEGSYHANVQGGALRDELAKSGYLVVRSTVVRQNGRFDFRLLDRMLEDRFDLVVIVHGNDPIARHVSAAGVPFVVVQDHPWEECRGLGLSFGYNRFERATDYLTAGECVRLLVRVVAGGGNLLLNIGPDRHGFVPPIMEDRLLEIGRWLDVNGEAIYGTTRWRKSPGDAKMNAGDLFFTEKGSVVYAIATRWPTAAFRVEGVRNVASVTLLGSDAKVDWTAEPDALTITPPMVNPGNAPCDHAWTFKISL